MLGQLKGTHHDEHSFPALHRAHKASGIRPAISHTIDVVDHRDGGRDSKKKIGLPTSVSGRRTCTDYDVQPLRCRVGQDFNKPHVKGKLGFHGSSDCNKTL